MGLFPPGGLLRQLLKGALGGPWGLWCLLPSDCDLDLPHTRDLELGRLLHTLAAVLDPFQFLENQRCKSPFLSQRGPGRRALARLGSAQ
jgi:hypothetical protein